MRNANQILGIITAAFGPEMFDRGGSTAVCSGPQTDVEELACEWRSLAGSAEARGDGADVDGEWISTASQVREENQAELPWLTETGLTALCSGSAKPSAS